MSRPSFSNEWAKDFVTSADGDIHAPADTCVDCGGYPVTGSTGAPSVDAGHDAGSSDAGRDGKALADASADAIRE